MNTAFGMANLWLEGDAITRFVAVLLIALSIITWVILLSRYWSLRKLRQVKLQTEQF